MASEITVAILTAGGFFWLAGGVGAFVAARLLKSSSNSLLVNLALGLGTVGYILYGIGLAGWLTLPVMAVIGIVLLFLARKYILLTPKLVLSNLISWKRQLKLDSALIGLVIGFFVAVYALGAAAPAIKFDDTWYHLTEAKTYLGEQKIRPFLPPAQLGQSSVTPRLVDILYTIPLAISPQSSVGPKFIHFGLGLAMVLAVGALGAQLFSVRAGHLAALMLLTTPIVGWLSQTAYIDLGVGFFGAVAFGRYLDWKKNGKDLLLLALLLGFFMATKLWAVGFILILLVDSIVSKKPAREVFKIFLIAAFVLSPWLAEAYIATGNPIFPLFSGTDQSGFLGGASSIGDWLLRVYWIKLIPALGAVAVQSSPWLALLPLALFAKTKQRKILIWLIVMAIVMPAVWAVIPWRDDRFLIPFIIPALVAVAASLDFFLARSKVVFGAIALPTFGLLFFLSIAPLQRAFFYYPVVSAKTSKESFLYENVAKNIWSCFDSSGEIKNSVGAGKVLALCHNLFYLDFDYADGFDITPKIIFNSPDELVEKLKNLGFSHLLIKGPVYSLNDFLDLTKIRYALTSSWLSRHFIQIYSNQENGLTLYEIK